jgi:hypothetical protein
VEILFGEKLFFCCYCRATKEASAIAYKKGFLKKRLERKAGLASKN